MRVSAQFAEKHLTELLDAMDRGDDVEIERGDKPSAKLMLLRPEAGRPEKVSLLGGMKGKIHFAADWNSEATATLLEEMFYGAVSQHERLPKA
ncbi:MAG: hypothetical protein PW792_06400 [Acidobacteriaceae bacterium]|nr:hypothetical protein [Acidobacteriaceae bacterium]